MLRSRLPQIAATLDPRVTAALRVGAEAVEQEAKSRVPVATGRLRDSIHVEQDGDDIYVLGGDESTFHGIFVELGTSDTAAQPFLIPAFEANREDIINGVRAALRTA